MKRFSRFKEKGQIALMMVLMMVIFGTVVLSVISRSITNVALTTQEESKIRAFSYAEAGIEDLLTTGLATIGTPEGSRTVGDIQYNYQLSALGSGSEGYELSEPLPVGDSVQIELKGGNVQNLNIYWNNKASLEISIYSQNGGVYSLRRQAVNCYNCDPNNDFASADRSDKENYESKRNITLDPAQDIFLRIKALYDQTPLLVQPASGSLPAQAYKVKVTTSEGESTAAVEVIQSLPAAPGIFDYALWSGSSIP